MDSEKAFEHPKVSGGLGLQRDQQGPHGQVASGTHALHHPLEVLVLAASLSIDALGRSSQTLAVAMRRLAINFLDL